MVLRDAGLEVEIDSVYIQHKKKGGPKEADVTEGCHGLRIREWEPGNFQLSSMDAYASV